MSMGESVSPPRSNWLRSRGWGRRPLTPCDDWRTRPRSTPTSSRSERTSLLTRDDRLVTLDSSDVTRALSESRAVLDGVLDSRGMGEDDLDVEGAAVEGRRGAVVEVGEWNSADSDTIDELAGGAEESPMFPFWFDGDGDDGVWKSSEKEPALDPPALRSLAWSS